MTVDDLPGDQYGELVHLIPPEEALTDQITRVRDAIARGIMALQELEGSGSVQVSELAAEALDDVAELLGTA